MHPLDSWVRQGHRLSERTGKTRGTEGKCDIVDSDSLEEFGKIGGHGGGAQGTQRLGRAARLQIKALHLVTILALEAILILRALVSQN